MTTIIDSNNNISTGPTITTDLDTTNTIPHNTEHEHDQSPLFSNIIPNSSLYLSHPTNITITYPSIILFSFVSFMLMICLFISLIVYLANIPNDITINVCYIFFLIELFIQLTKTIISLKYRSIHCDRSYSYIEWHYMLPYNNRPYSGILKILDLAIVVSLSILSNMFTPFNTCHDTNYILCIIIRVRVVIFIGWSILLLLLLVSAIIKYIRNRTREMISRRRICRTLVNLPNIANFASSDDTCTICMDSNNTNLVKLNCNHIFHRICITTWLSKNTTCPICRDTAVPV